MQTFSQMFCFQTKKCSNLMLICLNLQPSCASTHRRGEEITIDYSTFCVDCAEFSCSCGAPSCRRVVKGDDW